MRGVGVIFWAAARMVVARSKSAGRDGIVRCVIEDGEASRCEAEEEGIRERC